jgi:hypothetical protein
LPGFGLQQQVEVVAHQDIAEQAKWKAQLGLRQSLEKSPEIRRFEEDAVPVVATIDRVVNQPIRNGSQGSAHDGHPTAIPAHLQENELTPIFLN